MAEPRTLYGLSDIKNIWVPCADCGEEVPFPLDHGFDPRDVQHIVTACPHCLREGFTGTFQAIRRVMRLSGEERLPIEGKGKVINLLSKIKIELNPTSIES